MKNTEVLAIDLGASSGRGIIGKFDGNKITLEEIHRFPNEPVINAGQFNWDILRIFHEVKNAIHNCSLGEHKDIKSIGIDTWGVDFGLLDKNGHLLGNPVHYRDARNDGMVKEAFKTMSAEKLYGLTGIQFVDFNTLFQLIAVKKNDPEILACAKDLLFIPDLLAYFLTGNKQTEYTIASTGQLLDAFERNWSEELIKEFGLPREIFGKIVEPGTICGELLPQVKEEVGDINAKVVSIAAHDTASCVLAVPASTDKFIFISSGTWSIMGTETKDPVISSKGLEYNFANEGGYNRTIRFLKNITGLWVEQESRRQWKREGEDIGFGELTKMAEESKPLQFLIDPDDERFSTPGNIPKRIVEFCEETNQGTPKTKGEIVRCIVDSLAMRYRYTVEKIDELCGERMPAINIVGGGTQKKILNQFTANACKRTVYAGPVEATAIGNIVAQLIALGEIKDVKEARQIIANSFEIEKYEPMDTEAWDEAYSRFVKIMKK